MKHASEEQLIDLLMGEETAPGIRQHLDTCRDCSERYRRLETGLSAARAIKPAIPLMPVPRISYEKFKRNTMRVRLAWIAAAAMLLLSLGGLRIEIGGDGLAVQMGLPGLASGAQASRIRDLEVHVDRLEYVLTAFELESNQMMADMREEQQDRRERDASFSQQFNDIELRILAAAGRDSESERERLREQELMNSLEGRRQ